MDKINPQSAANSYTSIFVEAEKEVHINPGFPAEQQQEIIFGNLDFAQRLFPEKAFSLCPVSHRMTSFFSSNCETVLGHPIETLRNWSIVEFFALIHPDDLPSVKKCFDFIRQQMPFDPEETRFDLRYRVKRKDGSWSHISNEQLALKITDKSYLYLMLYSNMSDEKFYHVKLDVYRRMNGVYKKVSTYSPQQPDQNITPRQNEIVRLIVKGFTNQEIADALNVSLSTVKNHKQNLFKKVNVKSSIELVGMME